MTLLKYAISAVLLIWFKRHARKIILLFVLAMLFMMLGYFFDELRQVYPRRHQEELMSIYGIKLAIQLVILLIGLYLLIGLFRLDAKDLKDIEDQKIIAMRSRKPLVIETRTDYLIKLRQEQKHEQND
ncbi:MAG: hypothetical protein JHC38_08025 [Thiotrichales bacterium]|jgi:uncharacterized protein YneF (UPF0154 family)|nr:hypothetical protein [Thiotrichales bacterium]